MAIDESIMQHVAKGISPPTLRFYGWNPPALSLGYFQSGEKSIDIPGCRAMGVDIVRRMTGGRAILHDKELTYSIVLPESYEGIPSSVTESYKLISQGLVEGFAQLGITAQLAPPATLKPGMFTSGACFEAPSSYELEVDGRKIAGSAQVRQNGAILQHGSIMNELDSNMLFRCLSFESESVREKAESIFINKAASIENVKGKPVQWDELCSAFYKGFQIGLDITMEPGALSEEEKSLAKVLEDKYRSNEWNFKK